MVGRDFAVRILGKPGDAAQWQGYAEGEHTPNFNATHLGAVGIAEQYAPESDRYLVTPIWEFLINGSLDQPALSEAFARLPEIQRRVIFNPPHTLDAGFRDFTETTCTNLARNLSFSTLECLVLLAPHAQLIGSKSLSDGVATTYHRLRDAFGQLPELRADFGDLKVVLDRRFQFPVFPVAGERVDVWLEKDDRRPIEPTSVATLSTKSRILTTLNRSGSALMAITLLTMLAFSIDAKAANVAILLIPIIACIAAATSNRAFSFKYREQHLSQSGG